MGSALSASAPGASGSSPVTNDTDLDSNNDNENNDDYNDDASSVDDNEDGLEGAGAPPEEDAESRKARLLRGVVRTNEDYGLGEFVRLPDASADAPAVFEDVELQASTFFASRSVVRAGGFSEEDPPICARCLRWNLTAPFSRCNRDGWTACGHCSYIQKARCKDVGPLTPSGTFPAANRTRCPRSSCPMALIAQMKM